MLKIQKRNFYFFWIPFYIFLKTSTSDRENIDDKFKNDFYSEKFSENLIEYLTETFENNIYKKSRTLLRETLYGIDDEDFFDPYLFEKFIKLFSIGCPKNNSQIYINRIIFIYFSNLRGNTVKDSEFKMFEEIKQTKSNKFETRLKILIDKVRNYILTIFKDHLSDLKGLFYESDVSIFAKEDEIENVLNKIALKMEYSPIRGNNIFEMKDFNVNNLMNFIISQLDKNLDKRELIVNFYPILNHSIEGKYITRIGKKPKCNKSCKQNGMPQCKTSLNMVTCLIYDDFKNFLKDSQLVLLRSRIKCQLDISIVFKLFGVKYSSFDVYKEEITKKFHDPLELNEAGEEQYEDYVKNLYLIFENLCKAFNFYEKCDHLCAVNDSINISDKNTNSRFEIMKERRDRKHLRKSSHEKNQNENNYRNDSIKIFEDIKWITKNKTDMIYEKYINPKNKNNDKVTKIKPNEEKNKKFYGEKIQKYTSLLNKDLENDDESAKSVTDDKQYSLKKEENKKNISIKTDDISDNEQNKIDLSDDNEGFVVFLKKRGKNIAKKTKKINNIPEESKSYKIRSAINQNSSNKESNFSNTGSAIKILENKNDKPTQKVTPFKNVFEKGNIQKSLSDHEKKISGLKTNQTYEIIPEKENKNLKIGFAYKNPGIINSVWNNKEDNKILKKSLGGSFKNEKEEADKKVEKIQQNNHDNNSEIYIGNIEAWKPIIDGNHGSKNLKDKNLTFDTHDRDHPKIIVKRDNYNSNVNNLSSITILGYFQTSSSREIYYQLLFFTEDNLQEFQNLFLSNIQAYEDSGYFQYLLASYRDSVKINDLSINMCFINKLAEFTMHASSISDGNDNNISLYGLFTSDIIMLFRCECNHLTSFTIRYLNILINKGVFITVFENHCEYRYSDKLIQYHINHNNLLFSYKVSRNIFKKHLKKLYIKHNETEKNEKFIHFGVVFNLNECDCGRDARNITVYHTRGVGNNMGITTFELN